MEFDNNLRHAHRYYKGKRIRKLEPLLLRPTYELYMTEAECVVLKLTMPIEITHIEDHSSEESKNFYKHGSEI